MCARWPAVADGADCVGMVMLANGCQRHTDLERFGSGPVWVPVAPLMRIIGSTGGNAIANKNCPFYIEADE